jgi:hypothetical protein
LHSQGGADRPPPLAPAKALRSVASVPTRQRSSTVLGVIGSTAAATSESPCSVATTTKPQQVAMATTAVMTVAATAPSVLPAPAPAGGN